jgi:hypothetical protein
MASRFGAQGCDETRFGCCACGVQRAQIDLDGLTPPTFLPPRTVEFEHVLFVALIAALLREQRRNISKCTHNRMRTQIDKRFALAVPVVQKHHRRSRRLCAATVVA